MKTGARFMIMLAVFGAVVSACYWLTSSEPSGTVMLASTCLLSLVPASYVLWWARRTPTGPEDNPDANPEDGAGVIGAFPVTSIWPFVLGIGSAFIGLSFIFGAWTAVFGFALAVAVSFGVVMESRRGGVH